MFLIFLIDFRFLFKLLVSYMFFKMYLIFCNLQLQILPFQVSSTPPPPPYCHLYSLKTLTYFTERENSLNWELITLGASSKHLSPQSCWFINYQSDVLWSNPLCLWSLLKNRSIVLFFEDEFSDLASPAGPSLAQSPQRCQQVASLSVLQITGGQVSLWWILSELQISSF